MNYTNKKIFGILLLKNEFDIVAGPSGRLAVFNTIQNFFTCFVRSDAPKSSSLGYVACWRGRRQSHTRTEFVCQPSYVAPYSRPSLGFFFNVRQENWD